MTEFEELALKKIIKDCLIDSVYQKINLITGRFGISNAEISKKIGWDQAGYNQKYNRSNDLRITTFIKIYTALIELVKDKGMGDQSQSIRLDELITQYELELGHLFNHVSAAAEGKAEFLSEGEFVKSFRAMRAFVIMSGKNKKFSEKEIEVYQKFFTKIS